MTHPPAIGLDIGSSSVKAVFLASNNKVHVAEANYGAGNDSGLLNPKSAFDAVLSALSQLSEKTRERAVCVGICSVVPTLLALDARAEPLCDAFAWADRSGAEFSRQFSLDTSRAEAYYLKTGCPVQSFYPIWRIKFLRENRPDVFSATDKFASLGEYIYYRLTRRMTVSKSSASAYGLFDINRGGWDGEAMDVAGIDENRLFGLSDDETAPVVFRDLRGISAIAENAVAKPALGESVSAHLGVCGSRAGIVSASIGAAGSIRATLDRPTTNSRANNWCSVAGPGTWIAGASVKGGGNCLFWLKNVFGILESDFLNVVDGVSFADTDYPLFLPFLYGEKSPGWNENLTGAFLNVKGSHNREAFLKSVMEGAAFSLFDCFTRFREAAIDVSEIRATGGFCYFPGWVQLLADMFQFPVQVVNVAEPGAFWAARAALNPLSADAGLAAPRPEKTFVPDRSKQSFYLEKFGAYRKAYAFLTS